MNGGSLPNLVIIGAQKCGTTSLHYYLSLHPQVCMSVPKELDFFIEDRNWRLGLDWYRAHFTSEAVVNGESSPNYTAYPVLSGVPERMHQVVPQARLIFLVRDPVERLLANYVHRFAANRDLRPLPDMLTDPSSLLLSRSLYATQLEQFLAFFPMERILVLSQDDLRTARRPTLQKVYGFLGLDDFFHPFQFVIHHHKTAGKRRPTPLGAWFLENSSFQAMLKLFGAQRDFAEYWLLFLFSRPVPRPQLSPALREQIVNRLRPDIDRFRALTGQPFSHWSI